MSNEKKMFCTKKEEQQFRQYIDAVQSFNCYQEQELGIIFKIAMRSMLYCNNNMLPFSQLWNTSLGLLKNAEAYVSYWLPSLNNLVYDRNKTLSEYKNACANFAFEHMFSKVIAFLPENKKAWQSKRCAALPAAVSCETNKAGDTNNTVAANDTNETSDSSETKLKIIDSKKLYKYINKLFDASKYALDLSEQQRTQLEYLRELCKD